MIESEVEKTPWGQITFTVHLVDSRVHLPSVNIVKNVRKRYKMETDVDK